MVTPWVLRVTHLFLIQAVAVTVKNANARDEPGFVMARFWVFVCHLRDLWQAYIPGYSIKTRYKYISG